MSAPIASQRPKRGRFARYLQSAERTPQWPRRWVVFGSRLMPVAVHVAAIAKLHRSMQKRIHQLEGQLRQERVEVAAARRAADRTQKYIQQMHGRIDEAGTEGLSVAQFIEYEHARVRAYRSHGNTGVFASEPTEPERRGFDLTDEQLEELVHHFEQVQPLTEDERRRAQAELRAAASKFRMRS